jgi:hypothetical protein
MAKPAAGIAATPVRPCEERKISMEDLFALEEWRKHSPEAPDGRWYKDFGSFKLCGEGQYPKTFLLKGQVANGKVIE